MLIEMSSACRTLTEAHKTFTVWRLWTCFLFLHTFQPALMLIVMLGNYESNIIKYVKNILLNKVMMIKNSWSVPQCVLQSLYVLVSKSKSYLRFCHAGLTLFIIITTKKIRTFLANSILGWAHIAQLCFGRLKFESQFLFSSIFHFCTV